MGFSEPRITTLPRTGSSAGWRDPDRRLLSISTVRAMLWAHQQSAPRHSLRPWGKQNHRSVLINGPSVCKTLQAVKLFSALSVDVLGIWWQLGGAWRSLLQNNGFVLGVHMVGRPQRLIFQPLWPLCLTVRAADEWLALTLHVWEHVWKHVLEREDAWWTPIGWTRVTVGQCVSITQPGLCKMVSALVLLVKHNMYKIFMRINQEEWLVNGLFWVKVLVWNAFLDFLLLNARQT